MSRKLPHTPRSRVRAAIRQLWLRSRERAAAIKREGNCCETCGAKGSVAKDRVVKIQVHHKHGIENWDKVIDIIYKEVLVKPEHLEVMCVDCHKKEHQSKAE